MGADKARSGRSSSSTTPPDTGGPQPSSRRDFLKGVAVAGAGVIASGTRASSITEKTIFPASVYGANERILTGHIGLGAMGQMNLGLCLDMRKAQPIAICDLWPPNREFGVQAVKNSGNPDVKGYVYHEELLANKDIDVVVISTPDHWHAVPAIMACEAGKDVWCEKPLATTIREGRAIVEAVHRNKTVFQGGTMQRSGAHFQEAVELVRSGYVGQVTRAETWIHASMSAKGLGTLPNENVPEGLDWERYLGWTPKVPFNRHRFLGNFRWFLDYSGGFVTDWGVHLMDIVFWAMGEHKRPKRVSAAGGKYVVTDDRTTPDTLDVLYEFDDYTLSFSNRLCNNTPLYGGTDHGIVFHGTKGTLRVDRNGFEAIPLQYGGCEPLKRAGSEMNKPHWENFLGCVRDRTQPICNVDVIHNTTTLCHMGTCAWVAGGSLEWDATKERFSGGDRRAVKKANRFAYRDYENGWSLKAPYYKDWA